MFEREYRELSFVKRWTIVRTIKQQNVAEHTFYVTLYAGQLADMIRWGGDRAALLDAALRHDLEETYMSDIPGPSKRVMIHDRDVYDDMTRENNIQQFGEDYKVRANDSMIVNEEIKAIIKAADLLDECFFLATEMQLGNKSLDHVLAHSAVRLYDAMDALPGVDDYWKDRHKTFCRTWIDNHRRNDSRVPTVPDGI